MRRTSINIFVVLFLSIILISCSKNKNQQPNESVNNPLGKVSNPDVKIINAKQLKDLIQNRDGRMLFINVWATWSEPSVKELPDISHLYNKYKYDVDFLSLSVDLTSKIDSIITPFLQREKLEFPVYIIEEKSGMETMKLLSPKWNGGIPASFIFDKNGNREIFILGRQTFENISQGIDSVSVL